MVGTLYREDIDELLSAFRSHLPTDLEAALDTHDDFNEKERQNEVYNRILLPAQRKLNATVAAQLEVILGTDNDTTKIYGKEKELKLVLLAGLREYFASAKPSEIALMNTLGMDSEQQYDLLTQKYDELVGFRRLQGIESITTIAKLAKDKKATVGDVKRILGERESSYIRAGMYFVNNLAFEKIFHNFDQAAVAKGLILWFDSKGFEIADPVGYANAEIQELVGLRDQIKKGPEHLKYLRAKE
ncbi:hypothetical protein J4421_03970 [Candidatus Woesearchaeota archaeon]|nr:hypothetical protein [Candidatus Woesearchaeota archaeon]